MILNKRREELEEERAEEEVENTATEDGPTYLSDACQSCGSFTLYKDEADGEITCDTCGSVLAVEASE